MSNTTNGYALERADEKLFAVYQTIYSDRDCELSFNWESRLSESAGNDDCFFPTRDGQRVGGALIFAGKIALPFLIPPFSDRVELWRQLLALPDPACTRICGVCPEDVRAAEMLGFRVTGAKRVMCIPADRYEVTVPEGFSVRPVCIGDAERIADAFLAGYAGSIAKAFDGVNDREKTPADVRYVLDAYRDDDHSRIVLDEASGDIAAVCLAGVWSDGPMPVGEIGELCVLPAYRGRGLARYLIRAVQSSCLGKAAFVKLCVDIGNSAEHLYYDMGFFGGPIFTNMERCVPERSQSSDKRS